MSKETNPSNPDNILPEGEDEDILQEDEPSEFEEMGEEEDDDE